MPRLGKLLVRRVAPDRKAPQVHRERKACKASRVRKVKRERRDHRVRKVLPASRARRVTRERRATKTKAPLMFARCKLMALWRVSDVKCWCQYSAPAVALLTV